MSHGDLSTGLDGEVSTTKELDELVRAQDSAQTGAPEACVRVATRCGITFTVTYDSNARTILLCCATCGRPAREIKVALSEEVN